MTARTASFLVPLFATVALLYQGLAAVDIKVTDTGSLVVIAGALAVGAGLGLAAAVGGERTRVLVFSLTTVLLLDMTVHPARLFDAFEHRAAMRRDARRVADLHRIKDALDAYSREVGPLPEPASYGEGGGPATFWPGWWDASSVDLDRDGHSFLDFLEERGIRVPLDPVNRSSDRTDPRSGWQYVYFVVPSAYDYQGGVCREWSGSWVYLLAISDLETESVRPPQHTAGSGCSCLWRGAPNFFEEHFDYLLCGTFRR